MNNEAVLMRNKTLLSKRLKRCVVSGTILGMLDAVLFMTDNLVSGRFLGEEALAGLTMMNPITTFILFCNFVTPVGVTAAIAFAQGKGDAEKANRLYSQGLSFTILLGAFFSVLLVVLNHFAIDMMQVSEATRGFASRYCTGLYLMPFVMFINNYYYYIHVGEGLENVCVTSSLVKVVVNISMDVILCGLWGTLGIGIATTLGYVSSLMVKMVPVIRSKMSLRFRRGFDGKAFAKTLFDGLLLSTDMICPVLFATIMNISILKSFGEDELVVFSIILNIENFFVTLFSVIVNSIQAIICQYHAEKNYVGIRRVMDYMRRCLLLIPGIFILFVLIFSGVIPGAFGVTNPEIAGHAAAALRIYTPFVLFLGYDMLLSRYYVCIRYRLFGFLLVLSASTLIPAVFQFAFGRLFGLNGVWAGLGIGYAAALLLVPAFIFRIRRASSCELSPVLLYDKEAEKRQLTYDLDSTKDAVMDCVRDIDRKLKERGLPAKRRNRLVLMAEENCMNIAERFSDDPAKIELCVICPEDASGEYDLIIRSDGSMTDVTNSDVFISSFRDYVLSTLSPMVEDQSYISKNTETTLMLRC